MKRKRKHQLELELRHLRYFVMVAEELNFTRAAERLDMAQPPLSQQIQDLEDEVLGVKLFERKRPLRLTQAGVAFLNDARSLLATLELAIDKTQRIERGESGYLIVGFTSSMANGVSIDILQDFQQQYPNIKLILRELNSAVQINRLRERQVDIVFIYRDRKIIPDKDLEVLPLQPEQLIVVLPERHPLAAKEAIEIAALDGEEFIMPLPQLEAGLFPQINQIFKQAQIEPNIVQSALFMVTILGLVAGGVGISILPSSVQNLQRKGVVYRPLVEQTLSDRLTAIWRADDSSAILSNFIHVIRSINTNGV